MIAFGASGATPKHRMAQIAAGLGVLPGVIVDQHFQQRNRLGRLLSLIAQNPSLLGLGVDEDTAGVVGPDHVMEVIGRGSITVVDGSQVRDRRVGDPRPPAAHDQRRGAPFAAVGLSLRPSAARARRDARPCTRCPAARPPPAKPAGSAASPARRSPVAEPVTRTASTPRSEARLPPCDRGPDRRTRADPADHRDARPARPELLGARAGHPAARRPRRARAVPVEHAAELHRRAGRAAADARGPRLLARPARRLHHPPPRRDMDGPHRRARRARVPEPGRHRRAPRQDARRGPDGPVQLHLRVPRGGGRAGGRPDGRRARQLPRRAGRPGRSSSTSRRRWSG